MQNLRKIFRRIRSATFGLSLLATAAQANDLRVCKASAAVNPVTGTFHFSAMGGTTFPPTDVAVGACSSFFGASPNISIVITEDAVAGTILTGVAATDANGGTITVTSNLTARTATFTLAVGEAPATVTFTNASVPGPPPVNGRWTGGGSIFTDLGVRVTHGMTLHCDTSDLPNNLEINFAGNQFHLDVETPATCSVDAAGVAKIVGTGTGSFNGQEGATIRFTFTDAGEPGTSDFASYVITFGGNVVLTASGLLDNGNQDFHPDNK